MGPTLDPAAQRPLDLLLVEDNPGDIHLIRSALQTGGKRTQIHVVQTGRDALAFLRRQAPWNKAPRPALILLDLTLPDVDGREVLREIKQDPGLRRIPLLVLTALHADDEVARAYDLHANCFIEKPAEPSTIATTVHSVLAFWTDIAKLPPS